MMWLVRFVKTFAANAGAFIAGWAGQAMLAIGVAVVATEYAVEPIVDKIVQNLSGAPQVFLQVVGFCHGDVAMTMVLSAYGARALGRLSMRKRSATP